MKLIFLVCNYQPIPEYVNYTLYSAKKYAERVGADICVHNAFNGYVKAFNPDHQGYFEKFELFRIAGKYSQALYIDTDILIKNNAPDIFNICTEEDFHAFYPAEFQNLGSAVAKAVFGHGVTLEE